ncbi:extracellular solute-binding protein [Catenulispora sp. NL8]|uniref:Extracellular solute-binding protein n=1 Tax=Catenulispora pinistramenti TaxID=2705254 RepID=A0ABS5L4D9_9ACTN|nr:extracellular solute-binding protein [Catenulispora pinistramenti]MBS2553177.1 extracellular solute-binding protein [Catenulispora pinistramenti]
MKVRTARTPARAGLAVAVAAVLLTSACGNKLDGKSKPAADAAAGGESLLAAAKAEGEVDYYETWGEGEPQNKIFAAEAKDFTAKTGIKVNIKVLGRAAAKTLDTDIASGAATPDLMDSGTDHIAADEALKVPGYLDDVTKIPVPGEDGKTIGDVIPANVLKSATDKDGHLIFVPHTVISTAIWYDAARFPDVAADPPKTWSDFTALLDKEKAAGKTPIAQDGLVNFYNVYWFYWLMMRFGGPGSLEALATDPAAWDKPATLQAAQAVAQLAKGGYFENGYMGTKYPAAQNDWAQGKEALNINGTWLPSETHPQAPADAKPGSFQFPTVPGGHDSVEVGSLGWGLPAKAKHPNAAKLFLSYLVQKSVIAQIGTAALNIPSRPDCPAPPELLQAQQAVVNATETNATYDGATANSKWWNDVLLPLDDGLLGGKITPQDFVAQGKKKTQDALADS